MKESKNYLSNIIDEGYYVIPVGTMLLVEFPKEEVIKTESGILMPRDSGVSDRLLTVAAIGKAVTYVGVGDKIKFDPVRYQRQVLPEMGTPDVGTKMELHLPVVDFGGNSYLLLNQHDLLFVMEKAD